MNIKFLDNTKEISEAFINCFVMSWDEFQVKQKDWIAKKTIYEKTLELMKTPEIAYEWELAIVNGLRSVDAKAVTVEFEFNEKIASGKISPECIFRILQEYDSFSSYNFETQKQGEILLNYLGAGNYWSSNRIKCEHIIKITYGKKVLYVRKKND